MSNLWLKIKIWTKVGLATLVGLYVLLFLLNNSGQRAKVWWMFSHELDAPLVPVLLFTFLIGVLAAVLVRTTFATVRQIRDLRARQRSEKLEHEVADMKAKAARLQTRPTPDKPDAP